MLFWQCKLVLSTCSYHLMENFRQFIQHFQFKEETSSLNRPVASMHLNDYYHDKNREKSDYLWKLYYIIAKLYWPGTVRTLSWINIHRRYSKMWTLNSPFQDGGWCFCCLRLSQRKIKDEQKIYKHVLQAVLFKSTRLLIKKYKFLTSTGSVNVFKQGFLSEDDTLICIR